MLTDLLERLRSLSLPVSDHAVFGSGPLIVRGIVGFRNDLDVVCRGRAWDSVVAIASLDTLSDGAQVASLEDGRLTFGTTWMYGGIEPAEVIDTAEIIDDVPFATLELVRRYKRAAGRPKDLADLDALARWERGNQERSNGV